MLSTELVNFFYIIKPLIPRRLQLFFRRKLIFRCINKHSDIWPIDPYAVTPPEKWTGWPEGKKFAFVLVHDVDTKKGYDASSSLMKVDQDMGFRSSFNFVPERCYCLSEEFRCQLQKSGFEVGVHDLKHDGKLFKSEKIFTERSRKINAYLKKWDAVGFRSGAMHCNLEWMRRLDIKYDSSTFDTDPFEPKPIGRQTIFPFWVPSGVSGNGFVELPYTLPQDFTLYILMREKDIDIWKRKLDWIALHGGMALMTTHPDYINFSGSACAYEEYPIEYYKQFLEYIKKKYEGQYWHALPKDVAQFFKGVN